MASDEQNEGTVSYVWGSLKNGAEGLFRSMGALGRDPVQSFAVTVGKLLAMDVAPALALHAAVHWVNNTVAQRIEDEQLPESFHYVINALNLINGLYLTRQGLQALTRAVVLNTLAPGVVNANKEVAVPTHCTEECKSPVQGPVRDLVTYLFNARIVVPWVGNYSSLLSKIMAIYVAGRYEVSSSVFTPNAKNNGRPHRCERHQDFSFG